MSLMRVSDPSQWCAVELDETLVSTEGIDRLLSALDDVEPDAGADHAAGTGPVLEAIEVLEAWLADAPAVVPTRQVIEPVLDLWEHADDLDPAMAAPLEALLAHLAGRHHTTTDEVRAALRQARAAVAGVTPPAVPER